MKRALGYILWTIVANAIFWSWLIITF